MFEAADIREWRGHDVVDPDGHKIGELEAVYVDTTTDLPAFGTVIVGMPPRVPQSRLRQETSKRFPLDHHRWRTASGRRRGHLQALRPAVPGRGQR